MTTTKHSSANNALPNTGAVYKKKKKFLNINLIYPVKQRYPAELKGRRI